jgi:hypothetical protein
MRRATRLLAALLVTVFAVTGCGGILTVRVSNDSDEERMAQALQRTILKAANDPKGPNYDPSTKIDDVSCVKVDEKHYTCIVDGSDNDESGRVKVLITGDPDHEFVWEVDERQATDEKATPTPTPTPTAAAAAGTAAGTARWAASPRERDTKRAPTLWRSITRFGL